MKFRAYAKINLGLEVLTRRPDDYHELRTVLQTIDLFDRLEFEPTERGIECWCDDEGVGSGEHNLAYRAAALLREEMKSDFGGVRIRIEKSIPAGRGLGGGSADAAVTLLALNELWGCDLPLPELHRIASQLGMDVPFFLYGGTALCVGRGDEVYPLGFSLDAPLVLINPSFSISTAECYGRLRLTNRQVGSKLQLFVSAIAEKPIECSVFAELTNDLETAASRHSADIQEYKRALVEHGAKAALMSGSGSSVFGVFDSVSEASEAATALSGRGYLAIVGQMLPRDEYASRLRLE